MLGSCLTPAYAVDPMKHFKPLAGESLPKMLSVAFFLSKFQQMNLSFHIHCMMIISMLLQKDIHSVFIPLARCLHNHMHICVILMMGRSTFSQCCFFLKELVGTVFACELPQSEALAYERSLCISLHHGPQHMAFSQVLLQRLGNSVAETNRTTRTRCLWWREDFHVCSHVYYIMPCLGAPPLNIHAHVFH